MIPITEPKRRRLERMVGIGLVNLATLTWATNMALGRWLRDQIGPLTLARGPVTRLIDQEMRRAQDA